MLAKSPAKALRARGLSIEFGARPLVMGILNVTPDSFSDGGAYGSADDAVAAGLRMIEEGADIIDIGGESTRPGHAAVDAETEIARTVPVIAALAAKTKTPLSIDTSKASVARAALAAGAHIINDVWGLSRDPAIAGVAAEANAAVVIMHNREKADGSHNIFDELRRFFSAAEAHAKTAGIPESSIVLDPGIGFGKTLEQNLAVLGGLGSLNQLGYPILLGASRKSFIGKVSPSEPDQRIGGSIATTVLAALAGIAIVRVHDVAAHVQALRILSAAKGASR